jgi:hypothetical protein
MGTITILFVLVSGLLIVLLKGIKSGVGRSYNYTVEKISRPAGWLAAQATDTKEGIKVLGPVLTARKALANNEESARVFIEIMKQTRGNK